jgi:RNA polymerase sigma factor (sigma-70 family)
VKFLKLFKREVEVLTEKELLAAYRQTGDLHLVGKLYQPYMQMVFSLCFKYLKTGQESEDAVMNIFEKLASDLRIHEVDNFKSWLHSVARNHCLMLLRSRRLPVYAQELPDDVLYEISDDDLAEDLEPVRLEGDLSRLEKCMGGLAIEQKTAIDLFYMQEKCYREIVEVTGFELGKVKSYIQNGKRNLKICMEKNGR